MTVTTEPTACVECGAQGVDLTSLTNRCLNCVRGVGSSDTPPEDPPPLDDYYDDPVEGLRLGGPFILDRPERPTPIWGAGDEVLWAEGEALMIVGPQGSGKSTLAQQLVLARLGIGADYETGEWAEVLGYPVQPRGRVLYLAMDRPAQIARSMARMVAEEDRQALNRLSIWEGPPRFDMAKNTDWLTRVADACFAQTVIVDSLKDAAIGISEDEVGAGWNRARQRALAAGIEVLEVHHQRKAQQGIKREPSIDDVYGSTWITSGAGSVILLTGSAGDNIVGFHHVKQPAEPVGPLQVIHDHATGRSTVWHSTDLVALAGRQGGLTALEAAQAMFDTDKPSANEKEKARRKLTKLVGSGHLRMLDPGDKSENRPARWTSAPDALLEGVS